MDTRTLIWGIVCLSLLCLATVCGIVACAINGIEIPPSLTAIAGTALGGIAGLCGHFPPRNGGQRVQ